MKSFNLPRCKCLACDVLLDAATNPFTGSYPQKGDVTVCLRCGNLMMFRKNLTVRALNDEEMRTAKADQRVQKVLTARVAVMLPTLN